MANHLEETRPEINTTGLKQQLAAQKGRTAGLVPMFRRDSGFNPLFATIIVWLNEIWTRFENTACQPLIDAAREIREAIRSFDRAGLGANYRNILDSAAARLRERLYTILSQKFERDQARGLELAQLTEQRPTVVDAIWTHKIRMTGDPDAVVHPVHYTRHYAIAYFLFIGLVLVEGMAGYSMFEFTGTSYSALAWSLITVVVLALTSHFAGTNRALINANSDAQRIYAQKCAGGCFDMNGAPVLVNSVERSVRTMARWAEATLLLWSLGLIAFRTALAFTAKSEFGWNAVFGSVAMAVLAAVYYLAEVRHAPKYPKDQQKEYERLVGDLESMDARIAELSVPDPNDPYPSEREQVTREYNETADQAAAVIAGDTATRRSMAGTYLSLVEQYRNAYQIARRTFHQLVQEAANAVGKVVAGIDVRQFENPARTRELDSMFDSVVVPALNDSDLAAQAQRFDPRVELPADRIIEFAPVEAEVLAQVQAEAAAAAASGPMIFRWNEHERQEEV